MTLAPFTPCPCCVTPDTCGRAGECRPGWLGCETPHQCSGYGCRKAKASNLAHKADPSMQAVNSAALDELIASDVDLIVDPDCGLSTRYATLRAILDEAYAQSAKGKGAERHANGKPWADQPINTITEAVGAGFPAGQAMKKLTEAMGMLRRGDAAGARREVLGAIVYAAALAHNIGGKP